ncbi:hypothetical protein TA05_10080 [Citrobacter rodentium]|nr:hypothetical protein TA05_10080 [Citrobacter rodentium]
MDYQRITIPDFLHHILLAPNRTDLRHILVYIVLPANRMITVSHFDILSLQSDSLYILVKKYNQDIEFQIMHYLKQAILFYQLTDIENYPYLYLIILHQLFYFEYPDV